MSDGNEVAKAKPCERGAISRQGWGEGLVKTSIIPHLEIRNFGPPTRGGHEYARHPEHSAEQNNPVNCFARGEKGSLTKFDKDSSVVSLPQNDCKKKKAGFTLAEVLITLGIIGVVAAMTIPNLMANVRAKQYTTKLKKVISTLSQAGRMSQAQYGFDYAGLSQECSSNPASEKPEEKMSVCALLNGTLTGTTVFYGMQNLPNYNFTSSTYDRVETFGISGSEKLPIYVLSDGSFIIFSYYIGSHPCTFDISKNSATQDGTNNWGNGCYAMIDVNGFAGPNKETTCSNGVLTELTGIGVRKRGAGNCVVNKKDVGDIFFVSVYDGVSEPMSNATWYVYNNF